MGEHCWEQVVPEETQYIYRHYSRDLPLGERPAILAIDLYNLVFEGGPRPIRELVDRYPSSCGEVAYRAIEPIQAVLEAGRRRGAPIIYTTGSLQAEGGATHRKDQPRDPQAYAIYPAFAPAAEDLVLVKSRASAFFGTPLIAHLVRRQVDSLIVVGESTSGCVRASVVDAYSYGYPCWVVEEGVFDRAPLSHQVALFDLHHKYATVVHLEQALQALA